MLIWQHCTHTYISSTHSGGTVTFKRSQKHCMFIIGYSHKNIKCAVTKTVRFRVNCKKGFQKCTFIDVRHSVESIRESLEGRSVFWSPLPTLVHHVIHRLRTSLGALHTVPRLQELVDLRQFYSGVRRHAVGRQLP